MKLDKIKFAVVIGWLTARIGPINGYDIQDLDDLLDFEVPDTTGKASADDVNQLMALMAEGTRKIEAIKCHRKITGLGLKESKEAVEQYWVSKGHYVPVTDPNATLGDILNSATNKI